MQGRGGGSFPVFDELPLDFLEDVREELLDVSEQGNE